MTWPFNKTDTKLKQAESTLNPFIHMALSNIDELLVDDNLKNRALTECYIYGAIRYLASYDDMRPESTRELLQSLLVQHFDMDSSEINHSMNYFSDIENGGKEQLFMIEGASALRRWLVNGDRAVADDLRNMLVSDIGS